MTRFEVVKSTKPSSRPYIILETLPTIEGPRTRVVSGRYASQEAAEAAIAEFSKPFQELI